MTAPKLLTSTYSSPVKLAALSATPPAHDHLGVRHVPRTPGSSPCTPARKFVQNATYTAPDNRTQSQTTATTALTTPNGRPTA